MKMCVLKKYLGRSVSRFIIQSVLFLLAISFSVVCNGKGFDNLVINYSSVSKVEQGKLVINNSYIFQINNADGDWIAEISIPYSLNEKISGLEGWITDKSGKVVRKLKKKDIVEKSDINRGSLYEDDFVLTFDLKHSSFPYQVHYQYSITQNEFMLISYWFPSLFRSTPTLNASLQVEVPQNYKLNILQKNCDDANISTTEGKLTYSWEESELFPVEYELFAPHSLDIHPRVMVIGEDFEYGKMGSASDWIGYGNWQCDLKEGMDVLPASIKQKIKDLTDGISDPVEVARVLYHYLQDNTRYINVSIDVGGQKPYPATYVAEKQYGDCKALTNYMQALLSEAGIESLYTIIFAGEKPLSLDEEFVGPQFNHVILAMPIADDTIWLETTDGSIPFGYLGTFTQNRKAMVVKNDGSIITRTPELKPEQVLEKRVGICEIYNGTTVSIALEETIRGKEYERWNSYLIHYSKEKQRLALLERIPYNIPELDDWTITKKDRDAPEILISYEAKAPRLAREYDNNRIIPVLPFTLPRMEKPEDRDLPVILNYPIYKMDSLIVSFNADDLGKVSIPESHSISSYIGEYSIVATQKGNEVLIVKHFLLNKGNYELEDYDEFYSFIKEVRKRERKNTIVLYTKNQ